MENDIMFRQLVKNYHRSQRSLATLKETQSKSGGKELAKRKRTALAKEQALEVQSSILLWNLISQIRKAS